MTIIIQIISNFSTKVVQELKMFSQLKLLLKRKLPLFETKFTSFKSDGLDMKVWNVQTTLILFEHTL